MAAPKQESRVKGMIEPLKADINKALEAVAKKHGFSSLKATKCSYSDTSLTFSLDGVLEGGLSLEAERYNSNRGIFGLPELGSQITIQGRTFESTGLNSTGSKVIMREIATGKDGATYGTEHFVRTYNSTRFQEVEKAVKPKATPAPKKKVPEETVPPAKPAKAKWNGKVA
jgi:hypothetical protein